MFPILSFEQNNPISTGFNKMREAQDEHRRAQLMAQMQQIQNQYAPQEHQANLSQMLLGNKRLETLLPYVGPQAQAELLQAQLGNKKTEAILPYVGPQAAADLRHTQIANEWDPRLNESIIGQRHAQELARLAASQAKPGQAYQDPVTGKWEVVPTTAAQTQFQKGVVGAEIAGTSLPELVKAITPYTGISGKLAYGRDVAKLQGLQALGKDDKELSDKIGLYNQATTGGVTGVAEGLIRTYGLNGTNHALQVMSNAIRPTTFDTPATYEKRIQKEIFDLKRRQQQQIEAMRRIPGYKGEDPELTPDAPVPGVPGAQFNLPQTPKQVKKLAAYTQQDLQETATKYGVTVDEVRKRLEALGG